jgi:2-methylcitrate dehydratase PrpD
MTERLDLTGQIARFATGTPGGNLPDAAMQVARLSLVDWVAVTLEGRDEKVAAIVRDLAAAEGGSQEAYVVGLDKRLPARAAALVNGTASHALDYDDTHFASLGHPSVAVIPAALAIADKIGASPKALQDASLIGMELAVRIGQWLGRSHYRTGFHVTPTAGTFGAAMAAARLLGLTAEQARNAIGIAASSASGVKAQFGTMGKPFHAGMAASNGIQAALLAAGGFVAAQHGLEGQQGFAATHHGDFDDAAFDRLGSVYVFEKVSHKFHACCHGTHAALEALAELRDQQAIRPEDIEEIEINVHPQYLGICNIASPVTGLEAKFSYRMVASLAMHRYDTSRRETFADEICRDEALVGLQDHVHVRTDPDLAETAAAVKIALRNGTTLTAGHDLLAQMDLALRAKKVHAKVESLLGTSRAASLWQQVGLGEQLPSDWMQKNGG